MTLTLSEITVEFYRNQEGGVFRFEQPGGGGHVDLELLRVEELKGSAWPGGRAIPFSLLFQSVAGIVLRPGLVRPLHAEMEPCEMSLQRIMPPPGFAANAVYYEAVFN